MSDQSIPAAKVVSGYHKPPFSLLRWLGFGDCSAPWMDEDEFPETQWKPGRLITETLCVLDWKDRLRVLFSGVVKVTVSTKTDLCDLRSVSRSAVSVLPRAPVVLQSSRLRISSDLERQR